MKINPNKIELIMAEQGLTSIELSKRAGLSRQSISIIRSKGTCTPITAGKIAFGLGVPIESICTSTNETAASDN